MIEQDTVRLLRECDAGVKMGTSSIDDVMDTVRAEDMKTMLSRCKAAPPVAGRRNTAAEPSAVITNIKEIPKTAHRPQENIISTPLHHTDT